MTFSLHQGMSYYIRCSELEDPNVEFVWFKLIVAHTAQLLIRYFYRHLDEKVSWGKHFESQLYKTKQLNLPLELLGDFNYKLQYPDNHVNW